MDSSKIYKEDWVECELGEISVINMGQSPPSSTYNIEHKGLPFFQGKAEFTDLYPEVKKWCSKPKKTAEINDILLSVRAPVGDVNIANQKCAIGRGLASIRYNYNYKFIWYYLHLIKRDLDNQGTGTTFKAVSGSVLRAQNIFLPPLLIQHAIVKKIEELFSSLDNGIDELKKAQKELKVYREAVLKKAFEGEWKMMQLQSRATINMGQSPPSSTYNTEGIGIPFFQGKTEFTNLHPIVRKWCSKPKKTAKNGDILLSVRAPVGSINLANIDCAIGRGLAAITFSENTKFLWYYLLFSKNELKEKGTGTTFKAISGKTLKEHLIPLPPLEEQHQIVKEIESRLSVCDVLEKSIEENLLKAESLRQSILKKAFEGKLLTSEEVEKCKQHPDYEPASVLLERIKAEKKGNNKN